MTGSLKAVPRVSQNTQEWSLQLFHYVPSLSALLNGAVPGHGKGI